MTVANCFVAGLRPGRSPIIAGLYAASEGAGENTPGVLCIGRKRQKRARLSGQTPAGPSSPSHGGRHRPLWRPADRRPAEKQGAHNGGARRLAEKDPCLPAESPQAVQCSGQQGAATAFRHSQGIDRPASSPCPAGDHVSPLSRLASTPRWAVWALDNAWAPRIESQAQQRAIHIRQYLPGAAAIAAA